MDVLIPWIEFIGYIEEIWKISVNVILEELPNGLD
jgi:hypothetical protein